MADIDWVAVLKGAGIAAVGAILTYGSEFITGADFGSYTPIVVAVWSTLTNLARKYLGVVLLKRLGG